MLTHIWKPYTYATCFYIEHCQIVCDPWEIHFMLLRSRSHTLHISFYCWVFQILTTGGIAMVLSRLICSATHVLTSTLEVTQKYAFYPCKKCSIPLAWLLSFILRYGLSFSFFYASGYGYFFPLLFFRIAHILLAIWRVMSKWWSIFAWMEGIFLRNFQCRSQHMSG